MSVSQTLAEVRQVMSTPNNTSLDDIALLTAKIDARLGIIESHVKKIDAIETSLRSLTLKVNTLEQDVGAIKTQNIELEHSAQAISDFYEEVKGKT